MRDALSILEEAVHSRRATRLGRTSGGFTSGLMVRREATGIVIDAPGHPFQLGEDVRIVVDHPDGALYFRGSILRVGIPVPSRSSDGLLVGYLDVAEPEPAGEVSNLVLRAVLSSGTSVDLISPPVRVISLDVRAVSFDVPISFRLVFPEGSRLELHLGEGEDVLPVRCVVAAVHRGESHVSYDLSAEVVPDAERFRRCVTALRGALGL